MDRVLLLMTTATYRAGAFLEAAARVGVPVVVGTERAQVLAGLNPSAHLTLDFLALADSTRAIASFAERCPLGAVIAADDEGAVLAAMAASAVGLAHHPVAAVARARSKRRTREALAAAGLPSPRFQAVSLDEDPALVAARAPYPCVLKPLQLSASRGVIRANGPSELVEAFHRVARIVRDAVPARDGEILIEDYIPGREVAVEGLLTRGHLRVLALFDKPDPLEGPYFEETIYVTPSRLGPGEQEAIAGAAAGAARAIGLVEGPVHAELRLNDRGAFLVEIAPRSIGGLCSRTLRFGDGVSLEELILRHALGQEVESLEREPLAAGVMMIPIPRAGRLEGVTGREEALRIPGIEDIRVTIPPGQEVVPLPEGSRYLGFIFARETSPERVEEALRAAHRLLRFEIQAPSRAGRGGARSGMRDSSW